MKKLSLFSLLSALALVLVVGYSQDVGATGGSKLEVTVTNLTKGQVFSPFIVATHSRELTPLFELGSPGSDELAALAEDGNSGLLYDLYEMSPHVADVETTGEEAVLPGKSVSVNVSVHGSKRYVTVAGMLVTTNDAFFALNGVRAPRSGSYSYTSLAYDAGTEANNEDCDFIPGPPCGHPFARDTANAEGYVYIHSGIHGVEDLSPEDHDWLNPVAKITIRRVHR